MSQKKHRGTHQPVHEIKHGNVNELSLQPKEKFFIAFILAVTFIVFIPSLKNGFTNWDDQVYVTENPLIASLSPDNIKNIITKPVAGNYHPVTILSLAMNFRISKLEPFSYHLVNVIFHMLNVLLVFYFTFLLLKGNAFAAFLAALLFGIHPMHVESVAWVSERKDVLFVFFFLAGLVAYLKYLDGKKVLLYTVALVLFLLSVLSKPAAVVFPVILLLVDYFEERKPDAKLFYEKIPFFAVAILFGILTVNAQESEGIGDFEQYSVIQRVMFASYGLVMYVVKLFVPFQMSVLHPYPDVEKIPWIYSLSPVIAMGLFVAIFYSMKKTRVVAFGFLFYLVSVALVLQFVSVGRAIMAERYTYLAYVGLLIPLGWSLNYLLYERIRDNTFRNIALVVLLIYLGALAYQTFERNKVWRTSETLWTDVIQKYPDDWYAYVGRGNYLLKQKDFQKAFNDYNKAIALKAVVADPYIARGNLYRKNKQYPEALKDYNTAVSIAPNRHSIYNDRGSLYFDLDKDDLALADFKKALELKPDLYQTYNNMGSVYSRQGDFATGLNYYNKAIEMNPLFADTYLNRAILYTLTEKHELAKPDFDKYFVFNAGNISPDSYYWRGLNGHHLKNYSGAINDFSEAIKSNPKVGEYYLVRSKSYNALGNKKQALADAYNAQSLGIAVEAEYMNSLRN